MRVQMLVVSLSSVLLLSGCASVITGTARSKEVPGAVLHQPVTSNLEVRNTRATGRATVTLRQEALGRNNALRAAIASAQADVLVAPTYTVERDGSNLTVTVTGYPATYKDFRSATAADLELLSAAAADKSDAATSEAAPVLPISKTGRLILFGSTFLLLVLSGAIGA